MYIGWVIGNITAFILGKHFLQPKFLISLLAGLVLFILLAVPEVFGLINTSNPVRLILGFPLGFCAVLLIYVPTILLIQEVNRSSRLRD